MLSFFFFCSISFIMLRPVVVVGIGSPKGNARITVFFFGVCFCAWRCLTTTTLRVPWRQFRYARAREPAIERQVPFEKFTKKISFEVNAHFTFSVPFFLFFFDCESEIFILCCCGCCDG